MLAYIYIYHTWILWISYYHKVLWSMDMYGYVWIFSQKYILGYSRAKGMNRDDINDISDLRISGRHWLVMLHMIMKVTNRWSSNSEGQVRMAWYKPLPVGSFGICSIIWMGLGHTRRTSSLWWGQTHDFIPKRNQLPKKQMPRLSTTQRVPRDIQEFSQLGPWGMSGNEPLSRWWAWTHWVFGQENPVKLHIAWLIVLLPLKKQTIQAISCYSLIFGTHPPTRPSCKLSMM